MRFNPIIEKQPRRLPWTIYKIAIAGLLNGLFSDAKVPCTASPWVIDRRYNPRRYLGRSRSTRRLTRREMLAFSPPKTGEPH